MGSRVSLRIGGVILVVLTSLAWTTDTNIVTLKFGDPLAGLTADQLARFNDGKAEFEQVETVDEGLGPVFNDVSCASCHLLAATGGGGTVLETRFGALKPDGTSASAL
jgi:CxxC motif-containing protein (DUF1111 family)